jgi:hypothetical protein
LLRVSEIRRLADEINLIDKAKRLSTKSDYATDPIFSNESPLFSMAHYFQIILKTKNLKLHLTRRKTFETEICHHGCNKR